nr:hypothetical protein [Providencia rettgeri]
MNEENMLFQFNQYIVKQNGDTRHFSFINVLFAILLALLWPFPVTYGATVVFPEFLPGQINGGSGTGSITYEFTTSTNGQFETALFQDKPKAPFMVAVLLPGIQFPQAGYYIGPYSMDSENNIICNNDTVCGGISQLRQLGIYTKAEVNGSFKFGDREFNYQCTANDWGKGVQSFGDWDVLCQSSLIVTIDFHRDSPTISETMGLPECAYIITEACPWTRTGITTAIMKISYAYNGEDIRQSTSSIINLPLSMTLPQNDGYRVRTPFFLGSDSVKVAAGSCTVSSLPNEINFGSISNLEGSTSESQHSTINVSCSYSPEECPDCSGMRNGLVRVKPVDPTDGSVFNSGIPLYLDSNNSQNLIGFVSGIAGDNAVSCSDMTNDPVFHSGVQFPLLFGGDTTATTINWVACANGKGFGEAKGNALIEVLLP